MRAVPQDARSPLSTHVRAGETKGEAMTILWIIIVVVVVLALLGFVGRGRF